MGPTTRFVKRNPPFVIAFVSGVLIIFASTPTPAKNRPPPSMTRTPATFSTAARSAAACLLLAVLPSPLLLAKDWDIYTLGGREYVSDENVAKFYGFERFAKQGDDRLFRHPTLIMTWRVGSESIYVNNIKFNLSFPIVENGGMAMLSTVDLAKLVDPVVRPSYIRKPIIFDTVVIDAGHGAHDSGAKGPYGREKDYTLDTALRLERQLQERGFKTIMTRREDVFLTLGQRVDIANRQKSAIFISIHYNSSGAKTANGIETYALAPQGTRTHVGGSPWNSPLTGNVSDAENIALATAVHAHVISDIKAVDRGIKRARFNVLRGINKPGILFEGGFVTNPAEAKLINEPEHRERLASSIADAVVRFKTAVGKK
jgi:N-acetylmuramoyl-L-alanine amidase